jgi:hypothetical protein
MRSRVYSKYFILIFPFLLMVVINEAVRKNTTEQGYQINNIKTINTANQKKSACSWNCHNNTMYCKQYHSKIIQPYFKYTDPVYFGTISVLKATGNYGAANLIVYVFFLPLFIWLLILKIISLKQKIKNHG